MCDVWLGSHESSGGGSKGRGMSCESSWQRASGADDVEKFSFSSSPGFMNEKRARKKKFKPNRSICLIFPPNTLAGWRRIPSCHLHVTYARGYYWKMRNVFITNWACVIMAHKWAASSTKVSHFVCSRSHFVPLYPFWPIVVICALILAIRPSSKFCMESQNVMKARKLGPESCN